MGVENGVEYGVKLVQFTADDPSQYTGPRWLAARLTATGRASTWCRHYHRSEGEADQCGKRLAQGPQESAGAVGRDQ